MGISALQDLKLDNHYRVQADLIFMHGSVSISEQKTEGLSKDTSPQQEVWSPRHAQFEIIHLCTDVWIMCDWCMYDVNNLPPPRCVWLCCWICKYMKGQRYSCRQQHFVPDGFVTSSKLNLQLDYIVLHLCIAWSLDTFMDEHNGSCTHTYLFHGFIYFIKTIKTSHHGEVVVCIIKKKVVCIIKQMKQNTIKCIRMYITTMGTHVLATRGDMHFTMPT